MIAQGEEHLAKRQAGPQRFNYPTIAETAVPRTDASVRLPRMRRVGPGLGQTVLQDVRRFSVR